MVSRTEINLLLIPRREVDMLEEKLASATKLLQKIRQMDHDEFRATNDAELVFGMAHDAGVWLKENAPDAHR